MHFRYYHCGRKCETQKPSLQQAPSSAYFPHATSGAITYSCPEQMLGESNYGHIGFLCRSSIKELHTSMASTATLASKRTHKVELQLDLQFQIYPRYNYSKCL